MNRALPALALVVFISGCAAPLATSPPQPAPTAPQTAATAAKPTTCFDATLTIANETTGVIGVSLNDGWTATIEPKSTRVIDASGTDRPPELPWVAVVTDAKNGYLGSLHVQAGMDYAVTETDSGDFATGVAMRPSCAASANPYAGLPSNACGGFHLKVVNDTSGPVTVGINDAWTSTIAAGTNQVINELFSQPHPPTLPWYVVVKDGIGQAIFKGIEGDTPVDQKITITQQAAPSQAPYSIAVEGCGPA